MTAVGYHTGACADLPSADANSRTHLRFCAGWRVPRDGDRATDIGQEPVQSDIVHDDDGLGWLLVHSSLELCGVCDLDCLCLCSDICA